ncbi:MAG: hypothetical protein NZO58_01930, partial [Gemmataceae bacterium]|nr:hypothetical protein [Gemmataceae bacterium]
MVPHCLAKLFRNWLKSAERRRERRAAIRLEQLEDRIVPTTPRLLEIHPGTRGVPFSDLAAVGRT